jgi:hypothetical protein
MSHYQSSAGALDVVPAGFTADSTRGYYPGFATNRGRDHYTAHSPSYYTPAALAWVKTFLLSARSLAGWMSGCIRTLKARHRRTRATATGTLSLGQTQETPPDLIAGSGVLRAGSLGTWCAWWRAQNKRFLPFRTECRRPVEGEGHTSPLRVCRIFVGETEYSVPVTYRAPV